MSDTFAAPAPVDRLARQALAVGVVGVVAALGGGLLDQAQFFRSWLYGVLFWMEIAVGCLALSCIHHLTGGMWGLVTRRILEAGTRTLPFVGLLYLPVLGGIPHIYEWARPGAAADPILSQKLAYLNAGFFSARTILYFAVWSALVHFMNKWSLEVDAGGESGARAERRLTGLGGGGLLLLGFTITFSSIDWGMSLDPHWFSTVYGVLFMVGEALSAMAFVILIVALVSGDAPFSRILQPGHLHDLGKLLFAFVMLWAYISFSQFLIIWAANMPEEITWYLTRLNGGWEYLALFMLTCHFVLPFLVLLSRPRKRKVRSLAPVAAFILFAHMIELYWLVGPDLHELHEGGITLHWMDLATLGGVGGVWLWVFARQFQKRPVLPLVPEIRQLLEAQA